MAKRDLSTLPTWRLVNLASALRLEAAHQASSLQFRLPFADIPDDDEILESDDIHEWHA